MNEVPTLFLLAIVLLAVFKNSINAIYIFLAVILFGFLLFLGAKWYRRIREKAQ
jgi:putative membrane protein